MRMLPKGSGQLSCEIGMLAFWVSCLGNFWNMFIKHFPKMKVGFYGTMIGRNEQGMHFTYKKKCPDPLETLKPLGDFKNISK